MGTRTISGYSYMVDSLKGGREGRGAWRWGTVRFGVGGGGRSVVRKIELLNNSGEESGWLRALETMGELEGVGLGLLSQAAYVGVG